MAVWFLAITGIFLLISPLLLHFYFDEDRSIRMLGVLMFALLYALFFIVATGQTQDYKKVEIDRATCEFARTSKTLFVECKGGFKAETRNHYLYKNYEDSTKVGIYRMIPTSETGLSFLSETTAIKSK